MEYKYTAIIIEPRKHKALEFVLNNVCDCLSNEWKIVFFRGTKNIEYSNEIVERLNPLYENRIHMVDLDVDNLSTIEYSRLLATKSIIYDHIHTELFLVFQTDSMIFKQNAYLLEHYLDYDYVGAPWNITHCYDTKICNFIGNGGFSLRRKSKMIEIIENVEWDNVTYEDLYFSNDTYSVKINKPSYLRAMYFCVDETFCEHAFAMHKCWRSIIYNDFSTIYPECHILKSLQGCVED